MLNMRSNSDGVIVRDVLAGKQERFEGLVERHLPAVFATALAHTHNRADAEDIVQDTFINAYAALDTLRTPGKFGPWILTIARNVARKHLRKRSAPGGDLQEPAHGESPDASAQRAELLALLSDAVATLPEGEREAILLHYFSGRSARDVGKSLGVSRSAVLKRLERGRARMGKQLLDRLGDKETLKDAMAPSVDRVARGVIAATVAWQGSRAAASGGVFATTLSVLPKASTIAASLAGMGFAVAIGWSYLSDNAGEAAAIGDPNAPAQLLAALDAAIEAEVEPIDVAAADPVLEESEPESDSEPASEPKVEPAPPASKPEADPQSSSSEIYRTIDGLWEFTNSIAGGPEVPFAQLRLSGQGGGIYVTGGDVDALDNVVLSRNGRQVTALLVGDGEQAQLTGEFNEALTEIVMEGSIPAEALGIPDEVEGLGLVAIQMIGRRVTQADADRDEAIKALRESLLALLDPLSRYAAEHEWAYPEDLRELYPRYVASENDLMTNTERTLLYQKPPSVSYLAAVAAETVLVTDPDELIAIETYLEEEWGEAFMSYVPMIESIHMELDVHLQLSASGAIKEVVTQADTADGSDEELSLAAQWSKSMAESASCANNMKQVGLSCKMFENEQILDLFPGGWHMLYPKFISDKLVLTCPSDEPGTISYKLLYPATNAQYHREMALAVSGLPKDTPDSTLFRYLPFTIELDHCGTTGGRNVLFLDGHVARVSDAEWDETIAPYVAYAAQ